MADKTKFFFDIWLTHGNSVYRSVPYEVVTDWIQQGRLLEDDRIRPTGSEQWFVLGEVPAFSGFIPKIDPLRTDEQAEALEPLESGFAWSHKGEDGDENVDMIPLIDVSLVLLIFFMLTSAIAVGSRIRVPEAVNLPELTGNNQMIWIGINYLGDDQPPRYSLSVDSETAKEGNNDLSKDETLRKVEEILEQQNFPEIRVAAHRQLSFELIKDVVIALERHKSRGKVGAVKFEIGEKKQ